MRALLDDTRLALRALWKTPGFSIVVVLTLGVSIGATTAVYSVVDGVLLKPLPFDRPDQLVRPTWDRTVRAGWPFNSMGLTLLAERARSYTSFGVHGGQPSSVTVQTRGEPEQVQVIAVDAAFWSVLGVSPVAGRLFTAEEDVQGERIRGVLSEPYWIERYGGDPAAIGSTMEMQGIQVDIVGVVPGALEYPHPGLDVYISARIDRSSTLLNHNWYVVARLREGTTLEAADRELESLVPSLTEVGYPPDFAELFTGTGSVVTLRDHLVAPVRRPLTILLVVTGFVLLIGCVNAANLLMVRGSQRLVDGAVRRALGASPAQVIRYVVAESVVLSLAAGVLGSILAGVGVRGLLALQPASVPRLDGVSALSPQVLLYAFGAALVAALLAGAAPALRMGGVEALGAVRGGASARGGRAARHFNRVLVVTETALAVVVLVASVLLVRSADAVRSVDKGFASEDRLVFRTSAVANGFTSAEDVLGLHTSILDAVRAVSGVEAVGSVTALPLTAAGLLQQPINPIQDFESPEGEFISRKIRAVSPGYFEAMDIPLVAGRTFEAADHLDAAAVAIVSQGMAEEFWPDRDPLGLTIMDSIRVVGVVGDIRDEQMTDEPPPIAYFPLVSAAWGPSLIGQMDYVVTASGDAERLAPAVRDAIRRAAPGAPMFRVSTMDEIVGDSIGTFTFAGRMMALAAAVGLFLGAVGIYAVLAYSVRLRRGEIGLRMALGASGTDARVLVVKDGMTLTAMGILIGLFGAAAAARVLASLLYGVTPFDAPTYGVAVLIFTLVAIAACLIPASRAARVPPAVALRGD